MNPFRKIYQILPPHIRIFDAKSHRMSHNVYTFQQMQKVNVSYHYTPHIISDWFALYFVKGLKYTFNLMTSHNKKNMTYEDWLNNLTFLQTFTGVLGMVGGMCRHLRSLRLLRQDNGWIHHLLEQADNQRFHLMFFVNLKKPSYLRRLAILGTQAIFMSSYFITYLIHPRYCHRFVGYFQEQIVKLYTNVLSQIDNKNGPLHKWKFEKANKQIFDYYHFDKNNTTFRDIILAIRADKANHRDINHFLGVVSKDLDLQEEQVKIINQNEQFKVQKATQLQNKESKPKNDAQKNNFIQ